MAVTTNAGLNRIVEMLDADITHLGIGTGVAPAESDILLNSEAHRKSTSGASFVDGFTIIKEAYWDESEANGITYTTAGVFCDGATSTLDTGTLFSGGAINAPKDSNQSLTVSIEITVEAVNT